MNLTIEEAAVALRANVQTVRRWCRDGTIPAFKVGRRWLIPEPETIGKETRCKK